MSAYFILTHTVNDPQKYAQEYVPAVMPFLRAIRQKASSFYAFPRNRRYGIFSTIQATSPLSRFAWA
jgi:hypothetical protein